MINIWYGVSICIRFSAPVLQQVSTNWFLVWNYWNCWLVHMGVLLQLVVSCMQIILVTLLYADWILLNTILKLLEGVYWWLCHWCWLEMVDVAPFLFAIWSGEQYYTFVCYCYNPVIKSIHVVKRTLLVIFYKCQLTCLEVRDFSYLPVICGLSDPVLHDQFGMQLPQLPQLLHYYLPRLFTKVSAIIL